MTMNFLPADPRSAQRVARAALRTAMKLMVQPLFHPAVPVPMLRKGLRATALTTLPARGIEREQTQLGAVPAELHRARVGQRAERVVVYLHGGAYCVGSPATHRAITSALARDSGADVYALDYRLAPEHRYPAAVDDAVNAVLALMRDGYPADRITVAGDSAGGGLTLACALRLRDQHHVRLHGLILLSPWADLTHPNASAPVQPPEVMLNWRGLDSSAEHYAAGQRSEPEVSPLLAALHDLPQTLILVGSDEILLDDSVRLDRALADAGVVVDTFVYEHMWHVFPVHAGVLSAADDALMRMAEHVQGLHHE